MALGGATAQGSSDTLRLTRTGGAHFRLGENRHLRPNATSLPRTQESRDNTAGCPRWTAPLTINSGKPPERVVRWREAGGQRHDDLLSEVHDLLNARTLIEAPGRGRWDFAAGVL